MRYLKTQKYNIDLMLSDYTIIYLHLILVIIIIYIYLQYIY
jgi:hypothetical protein